jgi:radical SAM protein (TIGR01212 family)
MGVTPSKKHPMEKRYNTLSEYLKARFKERVYKVTLEAGFTCPNRDGTLGTGGCVFCVPASLLPGNYKEGMTITEQLSAGIERVRKRHGAGRFIAYFQVNTNTYGEVRDLERLYLEAARHPLVAALAVSTRPDCVGEEVAALLGRLKKVKPVWLELGLQSANDATLDVINRGHTARDFSRAVERAARAGIDVCAHLILGLPGEGKSDILDTIGFVSRQKVWGVKFHQLQILKGTPLEEVFNRGGIKPVALEEYVSLVVDCLELLAAGVVVHRLSGDVPNEYLVAPRWGANKFEVASKIEALLEARGTRQGARFVER